VRAGGDGNQFDRPHDLVATPRATGQGGCGSWRMIADQAFSPAKLPGRPASPCVAR
jgi:hypothetical protein